MSRIERNLDDMINSATPPLYNGVALDYPVYFFFIF